MIKVVTIVGARPQFIKAAPLHRVFKNQDNLEEVTIHTGQHYDASMSSIFFNEMGLPEPNYFLDINRLGHGAMVGRMIEEIEKILLAEKPDFVVVFGDTNSTLAGSIAAAKLNIKIAHIEAGLRSFNNMMPEEVNRILTDRISNLLFCPTENAVKNLQKEGFEYFDCLMLNSGDIMYDAAKLFSNYSRPVDGFDINEKFILATLHRAENTNDLNRLKKLVAGINDINREVKIVLPLHPRTQKILAETNLHLEAKIIPPVSYFEMISLLKNCLFVMTDSGGLQKEAYFFNKKCITYRDETEWVELVENGYNQLVGANKQKLIEAAANCIQDNLLVEKKNLYGLGNTANIIVENILKY